MKIMVVMPDAHLTLYLSASCTIHGLKKILAKKVKRIYRRVPQFFLMHLGHILSDKEAKVSMFYSLAIVTVHIRACGGAVLDNKIQ